MNKVASAIAFFIFAFAGIGGLLVVRHYRWADTRESTTLQSKNLTADELAQESEIATLVSKDASQFDRELNLRVITSLPKSFVELEAVHRQRANDACEPLPANEPVSMGRWMSILTHWDNRRKIPKELEFSRREVLTIGLQIPQDDQLTLPMLSKERILTFLNENYLSLQLRLVRNGTTKQVHLHHRPVAVVTKYRSAGLSQDFVEPLGQKTKEIRGLGVLRSPESNPDPFQIAVWLFRSSWQTASERFPTIHHEFIFIRSKNGIESSQSDAIPLEVFATSEGRTRFHYFGVRTLPASEIRSVSNADLVGRIHFTHYASDGLHPSQSVTRSGEVRSSRVFSLRSVEKFMNEQGLVGDWQDHLPLILDGLADARIASGID